MRTALLISISINILLVAFIYVSNQESKDNLKALESEKKSALQRADSARSYAEATRDSLEIAFTTIKYLNETTRREHELRIEAEKNDKKIIYVRFDSDTARSNAISELYPSYRNRR